MTHRSIFSNNRYIEYHPGDLNLILTVPHGGQLRPNSIPTRDCGRMVNNVCVYDHASTGKDPKHCPIRHKRDIHTLEFSLLLADELKKLCGKQPHIIVNHLYRGKLDANCEVGEAAFRVKDAEEAWYSFHKFIEQAKTSINGRGLLVDIHGQSHIEDWVELGYTISGKQLDSGNFKPEDTSISSLARSNNLEGSGEFAEMICGSRSLGGLIEAQGYISVPSPSFSGPKGGNYYPGGYNTQRHGSCNGGLIDAIQLESPRSVRRKEIPHRYVKAIANALQQYLEMYYKQS